MAKGKYQEWITEEGLVKLEGWARDGLTDEQIAHNMGITAKTLYEWKNRFGEICETLKRGKEVIDRHVENALLKRALGYKYDEITQESVTDRETGKDKLVVTKVVTKEVHPDTTAQIFWLKNRKPDEWRDKKEVDHGNKDGVPFAIEEMTEEQRKKRIDDLKKKLITNDN